MTMEPSDVELYVNKVRYKLKEAQENLEKVKKERLDAIREADQELFMWQQINELIIHLYRKVGAITPLSDPTSTL